MTEIAYVALGSNLGDREGYLRQGRDAIAGLPQTRLLGASGIDETEPLGPVAQGAYLNQMIAIETALAPAELLEALLRIERDAGRERTTRWGPRTLDLDIVMYESTELRTPELTIPHPELPNRPFWQHELAQLRRQAAIR